MADAPEQAKKLLEVAACQNVALEINRAEGTDFKAEPGDHEPADVLLRSQSGRHPPRSVQVVSIPRDIEHREDNQNIGRLKQELTTFLEGQGLKDLLVGLIISERASAHGMETELIKDLATLITSCAKGADFRLDYPEIVDFSPELADFIHQVFVSYLPQLGRIEIDVPVGGALPMDGRWIEEGIDLKVRKYGGPEQVRELVLVIDARGFVDAEQIEAFLQRHSPEQLPFAEIWITGSFAGTVALKRCR